MNRNTTTASLFSLGLASAVLLAPPAPLHRPACDDRPAAVGQLGQTHTGQPPIDAGRAEPAASWLSQISQRIRCSEYAASPRGAERWSAPNRAHDLRVSFQPDGLEVCPRAGADAWRLGLRLAAIGRAGAMRVLEASTPTAEANRVEYRYDKTDLTEWYVNDERGIEQGFTLASRPAGAGQGPVILELAVDAGLRPHARASSSGHAEFAKIAEVAEIAWSGHDGRPVLRYGNLLATDARGRRLPAHLALPQDTRLQIVVDDAGADYPVTIDPLLASYAWSDEGPQPDDKFGVAVATAGDVNGDGYSDVLVGAPNFDGGNSDEGRVYLYLGSSTGPAIDPSWTAESNAGLSQMGFSVATAGDVNGDGYDDVIVGAPYHGVAGGPVGEGWAFVWLGDAAGLGANGTPGNADWTAHGGSIDAHLGWSVSSAGDISRDGYDDILVGAPDYESAAGEHEEGWVLVWHGSASGLGATGTVANADWHAEGNVVAKRFGVAVASAGDVNGDGWDDILVGWPYFFTVDGTISGRVVAWYGSITGLGATGTPANADWLLENGGGRHVGWSVAPAGDVDGDGYGDVIVGAPEVNAPTQGQAYVFYGSAAGLDVAAVSTRTGVAGDRFGQSVDAAGDVNGDGFADVVIGAPLASLPDAAEGRAFVYQGASTGLSGVLSWSGEGNQAGAHFGMAVAGAGDVDGDGFGDLIVGAELYDGALDDVGAAFLYRGAPAGPQTFASWSPDGDQTFADFGVCVASAGDVNGDGYGDVVVGAPLFDPGNGRRGRVYVFHGSAAGLPAVESWSEDSPDAGAYFGHAVAGAGDVNGDGYDDLLVGAHHYDGAVADAGAVFLFLGGAGGLSHVVGWSAEGNQAGARFGVSVAGAGDVNGDGYADVIIGAEEYDAGQVDEGRAYVYYGSPTGPSGSPWRAESNHEYGLFGCSVASAGDVNRDGFSDVIVGESGYDGGEAGEGRACVYFGSAAGLATAANWTKEPNQLFAHFGGSVASAGDVNGDGFSDVIVGAALFDGSHQDEGRAWVYFGSPSGPALASSWFSDVDQDGAYMGTSVASAGDVNADGFSDVIVGGPGYDGGNTNEGRAWVYLGSPTGPSSPAVWAAEGNQDTAEYGNWVAPAGDVNGDGFSDLAVGAHRYDLGEADEGRAYVYYGNGGDGLDRAPQQRRTPNDVCIGLLGKSDSETSARLRLRCRSVAGRGNVGIQWEAKPLGTAFDGTGLGVTNISDSGGPGLAGSVITRTALVAGLSPATLYHWRMRVVTDSPRFPHGPWLTLAYNAAEEADFRTAGTVTAAPEEAPGTVALGLQGPHPNPSNGITALRYTLPQAGRVDLTVYDLRGRRVATLENDVRPAGSYVAAWDGRDAAGAPVAAGTYLARLVFGGTARTAKILRAR